MSDVSQGPGWWQASDGKWYPPETAPQPVATAEPQIPIPQLLMVTSDEVPGRSIGAVHGLVSGSSVRAKHLGKDIGAGLKNLVGGELKAYTELLTEARREALQRMLDQANELGANAVVNVRFTTSAVAGGAAELYAYGTAVTVERLA